MIGVLAKAEEWPFVEEFFQLFKTPWERFQPGNAYEVVLVATESLPALDDIETIFVYGSSHFDWEANAGLISRGRISKPILNVRNETLPIYGDAAVFHDNANSFGCLQDDRGVVCLSLAQGKTRIIRMGYDLFCEVGFLLKKGQPQENAAIPTLDLHIRILRDLIIGEGIPVVEIPPTPCGKAFISCLTHDIDFVYLRQHVFDHTMFGFLYHATIGSFRDFLDRRKSFRKLLTNWIAAFKLPWVHLGLCADFWQQFGGYLKVENGKPSTFFIIPFKNHPGRPKTASNNKRRATRYDVGDIPEWMKVLRDNGCEVALHGIDAWVDANQARAEAQRIESCTGHSPAGVRMHWLYFSDESPAILDQAGFDYDSTCGFNETVGYRAGTGQVFKPSSVKQLMELPMHIQDTALFYPGRMHLAEPDAWKLCIQALENSRKNGGVLTILWHDRSLAPERLWGDFYEALLTELEAAGTWFGTASQVVDWFRKRRAISFRSVRKEGSRVEIELEDVPETNDPDWTLRISWLDSKGCPRHSDEPIRGRIQLSLDTGFEIGLSSAARESASKENRHHDAGRSVKSEAFQSCCQVLNPKP